MSEPLPSWVNNATVVLHATAQYFKQKVWQLRTPMRTHRVAYMRHVGMYVARAMGISYPTIGRVFCRDHTTAMHGVKCITRLLMDNDPRAFTDVQAVRRIFHKLRPNNEGDSDEQAQGHDDRDRATADSRAIDAC